MKKRIKTRIFISSILLLFMTIGINTANAQKENDAKDQKKIEKQRKKILKNRTKGLKELYKIEPEAKAKVANAYGYAIFYNTGVNLLVLSSGNGKGIAHNNTSGEEIYMKMISLGVGLGIGIKSYYAIFVFENKSSFDNFIDNGWSADGQADATADTGEDGISVSTAMNIAPGVTLYQLANKGLAVQATVQGTKFIVDNDLNDN
jgi:lipid-binding SYLF domain-containing protein